LASRLLRTFLRPVIVARSIRRWELPNFDGNRRGIHLAWCAQIVDSHVTALPQRTTDRFKRFCFDRFQFPLPPDWKAIILARKVGIGPVGV
jgi:hypothetical protein